jgi:hypothetical protein
MAKYKNTEFREGYSPSFSEFKKSHKKIFSEEEMEDAYKACTGRTLSAKDKKSKKLKESDKTE